MPQGATRRRGSRVRIDLPWTLPEGSSLNGSVKHLKTGTLDTPHYIELKAGARPVWDKSGHYLSPLSYQTPGQ
jgi:hypothetical protein